VLTDPQQTFEFVADAYKSAGWNRDLCRVMAAELAEDERIDLVVTFGPWTVEDLLAAGFDRPIVATQRFAPELEGLLDSALRPIAENLTVRTSPGRIEDDLRLLTQTRRVRRLGFLNFPCGSENDQTVDYVKSLGERGGFEVITADGYDNSGTFAFFKAYKDLSSDIDVLYVSPLWAFDAAKMIAFFKQVARDHNPIMTQGGFWDVKRGALLSTGPDDLSALARFHAYKIAQIMGGAKPNSLPVVLNLQPRLAVNLETARSAKIILEEVWLQKASVVPRTPPEDASRYNLTRALDQALAINPDHPSRREAAEAARHAAQQAVSEYLPQLSAGAGFTHVDAHTLHNSRNLFERDQYGLDLILTQNILSLGAIRRIGQGKVGHQLSLEEEKQSQLSLESSVATAYFNYLYANEIIDVIRSHRERLQAHVDLADVGSKLDIAGPGDRYRWRLEWQATTDLLISTHAAREMAKTVLNMLLNQPAETELVLESLLCDMDRMASDLYELQSGLITASDRDRYIGNMVEVGLSLSPTMRYQASRLRLAELRRQENSARFLPTIGLKADIGFHDRLAERIAFQEEPVTWTVGLRARLPLFSGGDRFSERKRLSSEVYQIEYERDQQRLRVMEKVRVAALDFIARADRLPLAFDRERQAGAYYESVTDTYLAGETSLLSSVEAADLLLRSEIESVTQRFDWLKSGITLVSAVGVSQAESGADPVRVLINYSNSETLP
jgi:outer membrane protein TolC